MARFGDVDFLAAPIGETNVFDGVIVAHEGLSLGLQARL